MPSDSNPRAASRPSVYKIVKRFFKRTLREKYENYIYANLDSELIGPKGIPLGYLNMPKAGCSTIKNILSYVETGRWLTQPLQIHRVVKKGKTLLSGRSFQIQRVKFEKTTPYFLFTFVRHPGRRVFSAFVEKILTTHEYSIPILQRHLLENMTMMHRGKQITKPEEMPPLDEITLEDMQHNFSVFLRFVRYNVTHTSKFPANPHWVPQTERIDRYFKDEKDYFIGKVENFAEDFRFVLKQAGIDQPELADKRFNEGPKTPFTYEQIINPRIRSLIRQIYAADFERLGYSED